MWRTPGSRASRSPIHNGRKRDSLTFPKKGRAVSQSSQPPFFHVMKFSYSTVTLFARFRSLSMSQPRIRAARESTGFVGPLWISILGANELPLRKFSAPLRIFAPAGAAMWPPPFTPPSRFSPGSAAYQCRSPASGPHSRQTAAAAPPPERAAAARGYPEWS